VRHQQLRLRLEYHRGRARRRILGRLRDRRAGYNVTKLQLLNQGLARQLASPLLLVDCFVLKPMVAHSPKALNQAWCEDSSSAFEIPRSPEIKNNVDTS
jgi:hypothetical protein